MKMINGIKIRISRRRVQIVDYTNLPMPERTGNEIPQKKRGEGAYASFNYAKRVRKRAENVQETCFNSFGAGLSAFVTLTFAPERFQGKDLSDLDFTHHAFKNFIKRINEQYEGFRYAATFARQENGNWHYHILCNFGAQTTSAEVSAIWKNGFVKLNHMRNDSDLRRHIQYLVRNMNQSADELFGRKGYLMSRNIERDVQMKSWTEDGEAALIAITDALKQHRVTKRYETEKHIGIGRAEVNAETGEVYEEQYIGAELTDLMQQMGFSDISSKCEYYSSAMRCPERFSVLTAAKKKK